MGLDLVVAHAGPCPLAPLVATLTAGGLPCVVAMVDGVLQAPGREPPLDWRDVRLRTPAGTVTLRRVAEGIAVVVFGNADEALRAAQRTIAAAVGGEVGGRTTDPSS
jgi:hypothetical protein